MRVTRGPTTKHTLDDQSESLTREKDTILEKADHQRPTHVKKITNYRIFLIYFKQESFIVSSSVDTLTLHFCNFHIKCNQIKKGAQQAN